MRVAMYYNNRDVRLQEMPVPAIGPGELLVRVKASGICGTDVMEWYRIKKAPLVLGHEIAGEIAAVGEGLGDYRAGDRVFVSHHVPCMHCRYCRAGHHSVCDTLRSTHFDPGGFAEYLRVPKINVQLGTFRLPEEISFDDGSFIEPLACVVRAQRFAGMGADAALTAGSDVIEKLRALNDGRLADLVIVCTGAKAAIEQALRSVERGGTILFFAPTAAGVDVPIPLYDLWRDEVRIVTSYAASPDDIKEAIDLLQSRRVVVGDMITHRLGLADAGRGFELVASAGDSIKVIIDPAL
jgi:L-iditol 2-dehydrogenase